MSRCSICDYSQSAESTYYVGLQISHGAPNNRVVYSKVLEKDICLSCLEDHNQNKFYWDALDGTDAELNPLLETDEEVSEYCGCTDKPSD